MRSERRVLTASVKRYAASLGATPVVGPFAGSSAVDVSLSFGGSPESAGICGGRPGVRRASIVTAFREVRRVRCDGGDLRQARVS